MTNFKKQNKKPPNKTKTPNQQKTTKPTEKLPTP